LTVGHIEPRKNYERLLKAFSILKNDPRNDDLKLVIVGKPYVNAEHIIGEITKNPDVIYMNFVSHELLSWLYSNTFLFVFPSFYEGFGFTPLEAGCFNAISAVSNASSIPEVCGDAAAYFDPYNVEDMADTISRCIYDKDLRNSLHEKITKQIDKFSWATHARETLEVYNYLNNIN
jgi:glycosyltransferase involved in cell wall biosynthesis